MQYTLFGAIDIGSSEMELKIFELSRGKGMREIDCIRNRLELGKDTYATGKISTEKLEDRRSRKGWWKSRLRSWLPSFFSREAS